MELMQEGLGGGKLGPGRCRGQEYLLKTLPEESRPILDRARQETRVYEVEGRGEGPVIFDVINNEGHIRRDAIGGGLVANVGESPPVELTKRAGWG